MIKIKLDINSGEYVDELQILGVREVNGNGLNHVWLTTANGDKIKLTFMGMVEIESIEG